MTCWLHSTLLEWHYMAVFSKIFLLYNLCTESFPEKGRTVRKVMYEKSHVHHTNQVCVVDHAETVLIGFSWTLIYCSCPICTIDMASFIKPCIAINIHSYISIKWEKWQNSGHKIIIPSQFLDKIIPPTLRFTIWHKPCSHRCICASVWPFVQMLIFGSKVLD